MLIIKNKGKYFLKDSELQKEDLDAFHHKDISKNIINIIETQKAPYNIAIVGKWGLGKSSLIGFVTKYFKGDSNYVITQINAWKYEKEALRRVFLRQVLIGLGYKDKSILEKFLEEIKSFTGEANKEKGKIKSYFIEWIPLILVAILIYIIGVLFVGIGKGIFGSTSTWQELKKILLEGFKTSIYIPIFVVLVQRYIRVSSGKFNFKLIPPVVSTDEYEDKLKLILNKKNKTVITVIDDLDRLTPEKIVEALDAIKAFVNYNNCIFIVPFDDSILKNALRKKGVHFNNNENLTIESDLFLDKLFQYKIFLPNILLSNMPEYATQIAHNDIPDLCKLCGEELFDKICREILIHKNVTTPRQVKKILNAFSNNLLLSYRRENGYLKSNTLTDEKGIKILAKISVLQADYSGFYSKLFINASLIHEFLNISKSGECEKLNELLLPYFDIINQSKESKTCIINKESEGLLNFLKRTSYIRCEDISQYLYLSKDKYSIMFGDELSRSLKNSITSGTTELARNKLKENESKNLVELLNNILLFAETYEYNNCIIVLINIYDYYKNFDCKVLLNSIGQKVSAIYNNNSEIENDEINFVNLLEVYLLSNDKYGLSKLILESLKNQKSKFKDKLNLFFSREYDFDQDSKLVVRNFISNELGKTSQLSLEEFFDIEAIDIKRDFNIYFSDINILDIVIKYIYDNEIFNKNDNICKAAIKLVELNCSNNNSNEAIKRISEYLNDERFYLIFADILDNYANKLNDDIGTLVASGIFKIENNDIYDSINNLLSKMKWYITEESKEDADRYINENYKYESINRILKIIIVNNNVKYIPKTIDKINQNIVETRIDLETIENLQKQYDTSQIESMFNIIKNQMSYVRQPSNEQYNITQKLLEVLCLYKTNIEEINKFIAQIYNDIKTYPNNEYSIKSLQLIVPTLDIMNDMNLQNFINWSSNTSYMNSYQVASITILDIIKDKIEKSNYLNIGDNIMKYCTVNSLSHSLSLLRKLRDKFDNNTTQIENYKNFLLKYIDQNFYRKEIIKDIYDYYGSISDVSEYIISIIKYNDIKDMVIKTSVKFINEIEDKTSMFKEVIKKVNYIELDTLYKIIFKVYEEQSINFLEKLAPDLTKEDDIQYIFNLMCLLLTQDTECKDITISKILTILFENADISVGINSLKEVAKYKIINDNLAKNQIGNVVYKIFKQIDDTKDKEEVYKCVKQLDIKYSFMHENRKKRKFTNEEDGLIKKINKNNVA
ncbi:P-loop NTPase fold protein (plasmid) [Clostridium tyrobutyricum]|uniref:KAP family P-loop NTPase fold protein n=1 Tax=Clostridium tyrobutyricum TaxID=1519 RepID=UPI0039F6B1AA